MIKENILIVEDDPEIYKLVQCTLELNGYNCILCTSAEEASDTLNRIKVDLVLLDIILPGMDGFEFCKRIKSKSEFSRIPIIMLTGKREEIDRVTGFQLGVDDYIVKPFSQTELTYRIRAVLRRWRNREDFEANIIQYGNLKADITKHEVLLNNMAIQMTPLEFKLLITLMKRKGRVQSRKVLLNDVWDIKGDITTRTIDTHIRRLREKLGDNGHLIETVTGIGYRFKDIKETEERK